MAQKYFWTIVLCACFVFTQSLAGESISIDGAPADSGFNVGSVATIFAALRGISGDPALRDRYAVFADIQYVGTTAVASVPMDRQPESNPGELRFRAEWPIPSDAPTGIYSVLLRVEDRPAHAVVASRKLRGFAAYKKVARIVRVNLDKTFYSPGEPIQCETVVENLTDLDIKDARVEFSNANYPWISLYSRGAKTAGGEPANPELALRVLREHVDLPARSQVNIPMTPAGAAAFLQGTQVAVLGAGGPARHETVPPPEVDSYTVALWNADRSALYDMQFSPPAIVRAEGRDLPKPYGRNFTHPYNSDIDFTKYLEFYPPEQVSSTLRVDHSHTLYRPDDRVTAELKIPAGEMGQAWQVSSEISDGQHTLNFKPPMALSNLQRGTLKTVKVDGPTVPHSALPGAYGFKVSLADSRGRIVAAATSEIAVNVLPASLVVFSPHEDDEHAYAGLIRAAVEAGIPARVVVFTGGDVGACERYYSKPCGPNEAREFGLVRMEETAEALEHLGLARDKLTFLGLPDGGSGAIWSEHVKVSNPFMSVYLACDRAPYENVLKPNLPYARDAVIDLVKQIIADFHPAMIAAPHPDERHVDHRATNWFVIKACQELLREKRIDPKTIILADQSYGAGGFKPAPYHYEKFVVYLSGEAAALKQEMGWIYQSQDGNLAEGMKKTFAELPREEIHYRIVDWEEREGWNE